MQVTGDGEQPSVEVRVRTEPPGMYHEPQPSLFEKIFSNVSPVRQSRKEVVKAPVEGIVHGVERLRVARPQASNKLELELAVHQRTNADVAET